MAELIVECSIENFLDDFLESGGDREKLSSDFVNQVDYFDAYITLLHDYAALAITINEAGIPIDLDKLAATLESPEFRRTHATYGTRNHLSDMFALSDAGAKVDLPQLAADIKRAKSRKIISYDEYLEFMKRLFQAGFKADYTKFAKSALKDLSKTKIFKYRYHTYRGHLGLIEFLEAHNVPSEITKELRSRIGTKF